MNQDFAPYGLYLPVAFHRARDPDTIEVKLPGSAFVWALRLIHCWAPETKSPRAADRDLCERGRAWLTNRCAGATYLDVAILFRGLQQPLKALTFDRIPAHVYLPGDPVSLSQQVVAAGFASSRKGGKLGD